MPLLTKQLITDLDIQLSDADLALLDEHIEQTLDARVTTEIVAALDDDQLRQLDALRTTPDDTELVAWLAANVPELQEIIEDETAILLGELAEHNEKL